MPVTTVQIANISIVRLGELRIQIESIHKRLPSLKLIDVAVQLNVVPDNSHFSFPGHDDICTEVSASHPFFAIDLGFDGTIHRNFELRDMLFCVYDSAVGHRYALAHFAMGADANCVVHKATLSNGPYAIRGLELKVLYTGAGSLEALEVEYDRGIQESMLRGPPDDSD